MASFLLSSILSKTSQVLGSVHRWAVPASSSSDPRSSVLEDLKKLERRLKRIQAVLHDAEEREIRDEAVRLWLEELKEEAYKAEDVLGEYHYEELRAQAEARASRKRKRAEGDDEEEEVCGSLYSTTVVSIPDGMGDRIRERFDEISEDREHLRLREKDGERRALKDPYPAAPTSDMVDESRIFGREHDKQKVIDMLFSEGMGNGISVIPIVGKGGLRKTTIAQLVYKDSKVKEYFADLTGWVCVSDDFDATRLTKAIIESLTQRSSCDLTELSTLQDRLKKTVQGKRVLLVLDDVWNEQQSRWESLINPFVGAESTVRIIVTCRNDSVAEIMQTVVRPYYPGYLSPEQSWSLFKHYAFGGRGPEEQSRLEDIGKQIVKKCSGLPLAVKSLGSLLRHETDEDSWTEVLQSDLWELEENNETLASLKLSYYRMPAHLKPCFVYRSMFPKDYVFDTAVLVRLWMAQGYIPPRGRRRMEDIGDGYFNDLLRRSFFDSFRLGKFKMHDMIHDLAKFIAGNKCYAIVDKKLPSSPDKVRHLYVEDEKELVKSLGLYDLRAIRTLFFPPQDWYWYGYRQATARPLLVQSMGYLRTLQIVWRSHEDELPDSIGNSKHLRYLSIQFPYIRRLPKSICLLYCLQTLIIYCAGLAKLPDGVGNLTDLRYFELRSNVIQRLPGSICQLRNLQTLDVGSCKSLVELPRSIGSLSNLHHLDIEGTRIRRLPVGIRKLTNLQILRSRDVMQGEVAVLKHLVGLEILTISGLRYVLDIEDARDADLKHMHELQWLFLHWNEIEFDSDGPAGHRLGYGSILCLEAFPKVNKDDAPADEKREEVVLEYLQPHANLKTLHIRGYGGSKFPKWVGNPLSFASLQEIGIIACEKIRCTFLVVGKSHP